MGAARHIGQGFALVRPLDWRFPTNRAVLILAPAAGLGLAALEYARTGSAGMAGTALVLGGLTAFGGWALARELAPDDNPAAFACMGLALGARLAVPATSILPLFTVLMLARIVNRSAGVPATILDSAAVTLLAGWTGYRTGSWAPSTLAAVGFALDAVLPAPRRRQLAFAVICLVIAAGFLLLHGLRPLGDAGTRLDGPVVLVAALYAAVMVRTREVRSVGDQTGHRLSLARVRAAMALGWLMAILGALQGPASLAQNLQIPAVLAGLVLAALSRTVFSSVRR